MIKFYILYSENLYKFQNANKGGISKTEGFLVHDTLSLYDASSDPIYDIGSEDASICGIS